MEVSVIIPNYNYARYIEECINSVINSDFTPGDFEIVVVDDASTDDSVSIINKIKSSTKVPINLIQNKTNSGIAYTRNTAIKNAKGDYLFFLDSDNSISADCLKKHYEFLSNNKIYSACYAPIQKFDGETKELVGLMSNALFDYNRLTIVNYIDAMAMIKKEDLVELGLYDTAMPYPGWEDYELWLRMGSKEKKVHFIVGPPLSYYRVHKTSLITTLISSKQQESRSYLKKKFQFNEISDLIKPLYNLSLQIFQAGGDGIFSEKNSAYSYHTLNENETKIVLPIPTSSKHIEYLRFDIGEQTGVLNIHSITIKTTNNAILWKWDPDETLSMNNVLLIKSSEFLDTEIIQLSMTNDPQFVIHTKLLTPELIINGLSVELHLSATNNDQFHKFLGGLRKPLSFVSEKEISEKNLAIDSLKSQLEKTTTENNLLNDTITKKNTIIDSLKPKLENAKERNIQLDTQLREYKNSTIALDAMVREYEAKYLKSNIFKAIITLLKRRRKV